MTEENINAAPEQQSEGVEQTQETEAEVQIEIEKIPEHWDREVKTFLEGVTDPNGRNALTKSFKNFESGWQKKFQEVSDNRKRLDSDLEQYGHYIQFGKSLTPEQVQGITSRYGTVGRYLEDLHRVSNYADQNPLEFVLEFCNARGLDADKFVDYLTKGIVPKVEQKQQQVSAEDIERKVRYSLESERVAKEIADFEKSHEHFPKVRKIMAGLAQAEPGKSLEEYYNMAILTIPELREDMTKIERAKQAVGVRKVSDKTQPLKNSAQIQAEAIKGLFAGA